VSFYTKYKKEQGYMSIYANANKEQRKLIAQASALLRSHKSKRTKPSKHPHRSNEQKIIPTYIVNQPSIKESGIE